MPYDSEIYVYQILETIDHIQVWIVDTRLSVALHPTPHHVRLTASYTYADFDELLDAAREYRHLNRNLRKLLRFSGY
jgi:hypothetical protein